MNPDARHFGLRERGEERQKSCLGNSLKTGGGVPRRVFNVQPKVMHKCSFIFCLHGPCGLWVSQGRV